MGIDGEGSGGKRLFKRKRKYYKCRSTDYWQKKCSKQKNHRQNETGKSTSSQDGKKSDTKMSVNIVEKSNDKNMLNNENNIDDNANWMSTSIIMQDGELKGEWNLEAKKEQVSMFVTLVKTKLLLARYKNHLSLHKSKFLTQTSIVIFFLIAISSQTSQISSHSLYILQTSRVLALLEKMTW